MPDNHFSEQRNTWGLCFTFVLSWKISSLFFFQVSVQLSFSGRKALSFWQAEETQFHTLPALYTNPAPTPLLWRLQTYLEENRSKDITHDFAQPWNILVVKGESFEDKHQGKLPTREKLRESFTYLFTYFICALPFPQMGTQSASVLSSQTNLVK